MNRIPVLVGGTVLSAVVLCGGAVTVANAWTSSSSSQVLTISGVSTAPTASPSATQSAASVASDDSTTTPTPVPSVSAISGPGDDDGSDGTTGDDTGVVAVTPSDPTKIAGKGCGHVAKHAPGDSTAVKTDSTKTDPAEHGADGTGGSSTPHQSSPAPKDSQSSSRRSVNSGSGSWSGGGHDGSRHGGFSGKSGGNGGGSGHH